MLAPAAAAAALLRRSRHRRCFTAGVSLPSAIREAAKDASTRSLGPIPRRAKPLSPTDDLNLDLPPLSRRASLSSSFDSSSCSSSSSSSSSSDPVDDSYDAIVVGGGHNGLVAALLLAREGGEGFKVALFDAGGSDDDENRHHFGGAARTERPFSKGAAKSLRHSTGAYLLGPFPPELLDFCGLGDLPVVRRSPHYFLPASPNSAKPSPSSKSSSGVFFDADDEAATRESFLSVFSRKEWANMKAMESELAEMREAFAPAMLCPSPRSAADAADALSFGSSSPPRRGEIAASFVSLVEGSVADYLDRFDFRSEMLKAMFCATDGLSGATASPYDRGTGMFFEVFSFRLKNHFLSLSLSPTI